MENDSRHHGDSSAFRGAEIVNVVFDPFIEQVRRYPDVFTANTDFQKTGSYTIDSETILKSLANGQRDIFVPFAAAPEAPVSQNKLMWRQVDYLQVANAVFELQWREPASTWNLFRMLLDSECDIPIGFSHVIITYFKAFWVQQTLIYKARQVEIWPQYSRVDWGGDLYSYPHPIFGWQKIDLQKLKFTADDALRMAEANGGEAERLAEHKRCELYLVLYGGEQWNVYYELLATGLNSLHISVDPYTGSVHKYGSQK